MRRPTGGHQQFRFTPREPAKAQEASAVDDGLIIDVERLGGGLREDVVSLDQVDVGVAGSSIELWIDGDRRMWMDFGAYDRPFKELAYTFLTQFQDVITEWFTAPWPMCSEHYHMLVPSVGELAWQCPSDPSIKRWIVA